jgi:hypothetical protein
VKLPKTFEALDRWLDERFFVQIGQAAPYTVGGDIYVEMGGGGLRVEGAADLCCFETRDAAEVALCRQICLFSFEASAGHIGPPMHFHWRVRPEVRDRAAVIRFGDFSFSVFRPYARFVIAPPHRRPLREDR